MAVKTTLSVVTISSDIRQLDLLIDWPPYKALRARRRKIAERKNNSATTTQEG